MGTTAEKLQAVKASKEAIREALEAKGVQIGDAPLADYAVKIGEIEVERTSLNLDLKAIYDRYPEEPVRIVVQIKKNELTDEPITFNHSGPHLLSKVITSDGAVYTTFPATHTWDTSKDIPEDYPYPMQTRWLVICATTEDDLFDIVSYRLELSSSVIALYSDLSTRTIGSNFQSMFFVNYGNKQKSNPNLTFNSNYHLLKIPQIDTSEKTDFFFMFNNCYWIKTIPAIDTSAATTMAMMFLNCASLAFIPYLDTHNVTDMNMMFRECSLLEYVPALDMGNVTNCSNMFCNCKNLQNVVKLQTHNCENFDYMFYSCTELKRIGEIDLSSATNVNYMFNNCNSMVSIGFAGIIPISLDLSPCSLLNVDSLMSAINALKDLTEADSQTLTLGSSNLDKLTDEKKAIATAKNWILN